MKQLLIVCIGVFILSGCMSNEQSVKNEALAACLSQKNVQMYGAHWCAACKQQKSLF